MKRKIYAAIFSLLMLVNTLQVFASSHREAPLIGNDPLADNTDLYAFKSPDDPNKITIIANYVPFQLPQGGPNYYSFGENIRYEIHIDNNIATKGDDIIYRFTFQKTNEDPTTFFNIRLGKQNLKTTYKLERSIDGGATFLAIVTNGIVPPPNIGPRSISGAAGLGAPNYQSLVMSAIANASTGEKVFCGTSDDPFFVDLGGVFDVGDAPRTTGTLPFDGLKCKNVSTIAMQIDVSALQKDHKTVSQAVNILDPAYVIGIWASASRRQIRTLTNEGREIHSGDWIQVSRLGMPLTNEVVIPVGNKDLWNALTPYEEAGLNEANSFSKYLYNPELALYMDDTKFGGAVPALKFLRIQSNSLGQFNFRNGRDGLFALKGTAGVAGTAFDDAIAGTLLLPGPGKPRSVDLWPIFMSGVPNLRPYQLALGKGGNPLAPGKPLIHNYLPNGGDMLRLNMAVPATQRIDGKFSSMGLLQAAVIAYSDPLYNGSQALQAVPNMDGFPNGRRLEDDVTRIELQAVSGAVLAILGLWYDDFTGGNPVTPQLLNVFGFTTGVNANDTSFRTTFPYVQTSWPGTCDCAGKAVAYTQPPVLPPTASLANSALGLAAPELIAETNPNPFSSSFTVRYHVANSAHISMGLYDISGKLVETLVNKKQEAGNYTTTFSNSRLKSGVYFIKVMKNGTNMQTLKVVKN